jgi:hypothetical protein
MDHNIPFCNDANYFISLSGREVINPLPYHPQRSLKQSCLDWDSPDWRRHDTLDRQFVIEATGYHF